MKLIFEPQGQYRGTPHKPSRPSIPRPPRKELILQITDDDGYFDHLLHHDPFHSNSEAKPAMTTSSGQIRQKESLLTKLFGEKTDDRDNHVPNADDGSDGETVMPLKDAGGPESLAADNYHTQQDKEQVSPATPSVTFVAPVSEGKPTLPNIPPRTTILSSAGFTSGAENITTNLKIESSRAEISLLALVVLVLVVNMGFVIWIGVRRRRLSAEWHRKELQQHNRPEDKDRDNGKDAAKGSRLSSTKKLLRSSFLASSSGGSGLDDPGMMPPVLKKTQLAVPLPSTWSRPEALFGRRDDTKKDDNTKNGTEKDCRLFDEIPPQPRVICPLKTPLDLRQSTPFPCGEHDNPVSGGGMGPHQHDLVSGPPIAIPVSVPSAPESSSSASSSTRASISITASELLKTARRKSSAVITDTILPPVQAQMEVLTEIGRRVSVGLQAGVGSVMTRGSGADGHRTDDGEDGYGYSLPQHRKPAGSYATGDRAPPSLGDPGSQTPPEERYRRDLEAARVASFQATRPRAKTDSSIVSGCNKPFSQAGGASEAMGGPPRDGGSAGLVRRTNLRHGTHHHHHPTHRKRVSFVEGFVTPPSFGAGSGSDAHGSRLSSFPFLRRGSGEARRPVDEEMAGHNGLEYGHQPVGHEDDVRKSERRFMLLV